MESTLVMNAPVYDEAQIAVVCFNLIKPKLKFELNKRIVAIPPDVRRDVLRRDSPMLGNMINDILQSSNFEVAKNIIEYTRFKKGSWYQSYYPELTEKLRNEITI